MIGRYLVSNDATATRIVTRTSIIIDSSENEAVKFNLCNYDARIFRLHYLITFKKM